MLITGGISLACILLRLTVSGFCYNRRMPNQEPLKKWKEYFVQLYDYHYWANQRVLEAAAALSEEQLHQPHHHSWGSVYGVLLHMFNAEWIWLQRWKGGSPSAFPEAAQYPTLVDLQKAWDELQAEMLSFLAGQDEDGLQRIVTYTTTRGQSYQLPLWQMLAHVANHGTHHRGELAAMFAEMNVPHSEEDMNHYFLISSQQRT